MTGMAFCIEELKREYDTSSFFTSDRECIEYLLAVNLQPLEEYALIVTGKNVCIITPHELENSQVPEIFYVGYSSKKYQDKLQNIISKLEEFSLYGRVDTAFERQCYGDYFRGRKLEVRDITSKVQKSSQIKNEEQIERIKECVAISENAYRALADKNICKETELSVFRYIEETVMEHTGFANKMIYDFLAGARTGEVSGFPTNYRIGVQDVIIADLLPRHRGVYGDMTRTFFVGKPTDKQIYTYEILTEAMESTEEMLRPGVCAGQIYENVYKTFKKYGLEQNFPHHAGHGIGMGHYELPYFLRYEEEILQENMVVAIEPGLYYEKEFGIRIENNYLITADGAERLGKLPVAMEEFILPC